MYNTIVTPETPAEQISLLNKYKSDSYFCWLLQMAFSPFKQFPTIPNKLLESCELKQEATFKDVVETLHVYRNSEMSEISDKKGLELVSAYLAKHPEDTALLFGVINKNLFGLDPATINSVIAPRFIPEVRITQPSAYREDMYKKHDKWFAFKKHQGALVQIIKFGSFVEVYAKSGRILRVFDEARSMFKTSCSDGIYNAQLYCLGENGESDMNLLLKEMSKKSQSSEFNLEIYDYAQLSDLIGYGDGTSYETRFEHLKHCIRSTSNPRIKIASTAPYDGLQIGCYIIASDISWDKCKPKDFLTVS